jgi:hypothetical protein
VLIIQCQEEKDFPDWAKKMKIVSVEEAIKAIESTSTQPELRTIQAPKSAPKK